MRDIYARLSIEGFAEAERPMREFLGERSEHQVSRYELPEPLKRKVIARLKPYIDRFGYHEAIHAALGDAPKRARKRKLREKEHS
jgi:hypothetical protein